MSARTISLVFMADKGCLETCKLLAVSFASKKATLFVLFFCDMSNQACMVNRSLSFSKRLKICTYVKGFLCVFCFVFLSAVRFATRDVGGFWEGIRYLVVRDVNYVRLE